MILKYHSPKWTSKDFELEFTSRGMSTANSLSDFLPHSDSLYRCKMRMYGYTTTVSASARRFLSKAELADSLELEYKHADASRKVWAGKVVMMGHLAYDGVDACLSVLQRGCDGNAGHGEKHPHLQQGVSVT